MSSFTGKSRIRIYLMPVLISVSIITTSAFPFMAQGASQNRTETSSSQLQSSLKLLSFSATASSGGVLLEWQTGFELNNFGFNLYRELDGERVLVNRSPIAGSALSAGAENALTAGRGYTWVDRRGSANAIYYLETIDVSGAKSIHGPFFTVSSDTLPKQQQQSQLLSQLSQQDAENVFERGAAATAFDNSSGSIQPAGNLTTQWAIAAQPSLKIQVKKNGWYRITQPELLSAGLSASADASTLSLYTDSVEQPIRVSRPSGQLGPTDYIEFYGQSLSTPATDTRIYWLVAGTTPGKRMQVFSPVRPDTTVPPKPSPIVAPRPGNEEFRFPFAGQLFPRILRLPSTGNSTESETTTEAERPSHQAENDNSQPAASMGNSNNAATTVTEAERPSHQAVSGSSQSVVATVHTNNAATSNAAIISPSARTDSPRAKRSKRHKTSARKRSAQRNHFDVSAASAPTPNFPYIFEHRARVNYFTAVLNGETENFYGEALLSSLTTTITLDLNNVDLTAQWEGTLEIALQGVSTVGHVINVTFNGVPLAPLTLYYHDNVVFKIPVTMSQLREGTNTLTFTTPTTSGVTLVDYVRVTYAHAFKVDNDSLSYSAKAGQPVRVDGFTSPQVRVVDVTDPNNVQEIAPEILAQGGSYSILIPTNSWSGKGRHTFLAFASGQTNHADGITLNQPSQLNSTSSGANLLVIAYPDFMAAVQPLVDLRRSQGLNVTVVNVDDVYDEFGYGNRSAGAVTDFLNWAHGHWSQPPHYLLLVGCASYDPRNYMNRGFIDFVPSKLVDATFTEAASDDALADFDDDGIPEMAVGRLPGRSASEISKMVAKIVNFTPGAQSQTAVMVADTNASGYDFEGENADVAQLLPPAMTVQNVNFGGQTFDVTRSQIVAAVNQGPMLVNYSGHGTVNAWTGQGIFRNDDALALNNGNHLPIFIMMTCLTGYFNDPGLESMSESLLRADNGGAVASWASSGLTIPVGQQLMNKSLYQQLFSSNPPTLGDAVRTAKMSTDDIDVRHTWVLFGDPTMKVR